MSWHILPINDIKEHEESSTCDCMPTVKIENGEMLIIHNAWDMREVTEEVNDILKTKEKW